MMKMTEYSKRRKDLMQKIGAKGLVIIPSAREVLRNGDAVYPFRQNSDFYYLTGFLEPDAFLVLAPGRAEGEFILFNRSRDHIKELWDGPRAGQEGAVKEFLADQAFPITALEAELPNLLIGRETIHYNFGQHTKLDHFLIKAIKKARAQVRGGVESPLAFVAIEPTLHELRLLKSTAEIALIQKAIDITKAGHIRIMEKAKPGLNEYELEAELTYEFQRRGARYHAYNPIVGSGANTCILHYVQNDQVIQDGDLVLVDAGCEYQHYASDITRTFPANGRFTSEQRAIYELVLRAQLAAIDSIKPGESWTKAQDIVVNIITEGLVDLGILTGSLEELIERKAYFPFYMHRSGHFLGLDVHDVGRYRINDAWRSLQPDMVLTVEPGIYISATIPNVHKRWHNIGVRIEDNVLVTQEGHKVLSQAIPKTSNDIETIMAK